MSSVPLQVLGRQTLVSKLTSELSQVVTSVSYTTRKARPEEIEGVHYQFVTREQFAKKAAAGEFLESVVSMGIIMELQESGSRSSCEKANM